MAGWGETMVGLLQSGWALPLYPLMVRLLLPATSAPRARRDSPALLTDPPPDGRDGLLAVVCGVGFALLCGLWLASFHLASGPLTTSDFHEYCGTVVALREGTLEGVSRQRSLLAAALSVSLADPLGVLDGMATAALISMGALGAGLYLWGRALHSRLAGISAVLAGATLGPLVIFSRTLSFYPVITAVFTLGAASAVAAARWRRPPDLWWCGVGAGLCVLIDLRGLLWGLTVLAVGLGAALLAAPPRWPVRLLALLLPVWLAWRAGPWAYLPDASPLEGQTDVSQRIQDRGGVPGWSRDDLPFSDYVWGRTDPRGIPTTLQSLSLQAQRIPAWMADDPHSLHERQRTLTPILPTLAAASGILLLLLGTRRRAWLPLLATLAVGTPFVTSLLSSIRLGQLYSRYLGTSAPIAAVVLGVAFAVLVGPGRWRAVGGTLLAILLVLGALPSALSPVAPWREAQPAERTSIVDYLLQVDTGEVYHRNSGDCARGLRQDRAAGRDHHGTLYGGVEVDARERAARQRHHMETAP